MIKPGLNKKGFIILGISALVLVSAGITGYLIYSHAHHPNFRTGFIVNGRRGNFTFSINNATLNQTENFFSSNPDNQSVQSYCQKNSQYCFYYCNRINPENNACFAFQRPQFNRSYRNRTNGNFTQAPMMPYPGGAQ